MKRYAVCLISYFLASAPLAFVVAEDPYASLKQLPSNDASGAQKGSPYESLSTIPGGPTDERYDTLQNEYSAPDNQR